MIGRIANWGGVKEVEAANPREGPLNPVVAVLRSWKERALAKGERSNKVKLHDGAHVLRRWE